MAQSSLVLTQEQQVQVAAALEEDAQIMSNTQLEAQLAGQPPEVQAEIIRINTDARFISLQFALLVPLIAGLLGFLNSFRMVEMSDLAPSNAAGGMLLGG